MFIHTQYLNTRYRHYARAGMLLLTAFVLSACGHTKLTHYDGTPFVEHGPRLALDDGWVATDSCATGRHAVMMMYIESVDAIPLIPRWIHTHELGALRDFRLEGPWCRTEYEGFYETYDERRWAEHYGGAQVKQYCVYRVRAEYTLAASSAPDSVFRAQLRDVIAQSGH